MNTGLRLALRNLLRSKRRTALTMSAVIAGVGVYILGEGFVNGFTENVIVATIDGTVGHVLARPAGYPQEAGQFPVDALLEISSETRAQLARVDGAWTARTYFAPLVVAGRASLRATGIGYDPLHDSEVFPRRQWKIRGHMPQPGAAEVATSERVARLLQVDLGSSLVLQTRTHQGAMNALEAKVSAVVNTRNNALDTLGIFVPQQFAGQLLDTALSSHISLRLADRDAADRVATQLARELGKQASVVSWRDETAEVVHLHEVRRRALDLIMLILMVLAACGIVNTILMGAYERVREIGTLRALGMTEAAVLRLFVLEGAVIGVVGSLFGALWGGALTWYWSRYPLDFSKQWEQVGGQLPALALVYTQLHYFPIAVAVALGVIVAASAAIYPARVAARMAPADAVRSP